MANDIVSIMISENQKKNKGYHCVKILPNDVLNEILTGKFQTD